MKDEEFFARCKRVLPPVLFPDGYVEAPEEFGIPTFIGFGNKIRGSLELHNVLTAIGFTITVYRYPFTFEEISPLIINLVKEVLPGFDFNIYETTDRCDNPEICFFIDTLDSDFQIDDPICRWRLTEMTDSPTSNTNSFKNSIPLRMRCTPRKGYQINFGGATFEVVSFGETPDKQGIYDVCVKRLK